MSEQINHASRLPVITVTYSPGKHLRALLDSLPGATERPVLVVLADNGSTDGAPEQAATDFENVVFYPTGGNLGYGAGMNAGVQAVGSVPLGGAQPVPLADDFVLLTNPDVVFHDGAIDELLLCAARHPNAAAIGPRIIESDGSTYPSARALPSLLDGIGHAIFADIWPANPWSARYRQGQDMETEREAGWLSGSCLLVRREAFARVGGFDERYFMYFEDTDLGDRFARAGYSNVYCPKARISHAQGHSTEAESVSATMLRVHHQSAARYLCDRLPHWYQAPVRAVLRAGLYLRAKILTRG
ncbi:glycosyltransferase family 2 protein [Corynebacterium pseudodiphtheriticum]|uniref:glycosyltransferase family 2 protein n=1 Tax=Corynebacterium pseudodiphtheriticum TaxID=37637 RepID=UPI0020BF2C00|nr:glycosyltransferase family 2 protein [Corynebacterium pseudodiphtheriticum]UQV58700.1 glycosyltransferase family 2 protein [Corynebacterium pseudodiphtheriticum]